MNFHKPSQNVFLALNDVEAIFCMCVCVCVCGLVCDVKAVYSPGLTAGLGKHTRTLSSVSGQMSRAGSTSYRSGT